MEVISPGKCLSGVIEDNTMDTICVYRRCILRQQMYLLILCAWIVSALIAFKNQASFVLYVYFTSKMCCKTTDVDRLGQHQTLSVTLVVDGHTWIVLKNPKYHSCPWVKLGLDIRQKRWNIKEYSVNFNFR